RSTLVPYTTLFRSAFLGAQTAGKRARLELADPDLRCRHARPRQNAEGGVADVGAVEVQANAAEQILHVAFAHARIGTADARLRAILNGMDACDVVLQRLRLGTRMGFEDLDRVRHRCSPSAVAMLR